MAFSPEYLADFIPGLPFKYSISMPESSAIDAKPVIIEALLAFSIAFSTKVDPVSSTSGISISLQVLSRTPVPSSIFFISLILS